MTRAFVKFLLKIFFAQTLMFFCDLQKAAKRIECPDSNAVFSRTPTKPAPRNRIREPLHYNLLRYYAAARLFKIHNAYLFVFSPIRNDVEMFL